MNFHKLKYFIAVAEEQNITKAAKKLFISQPSLSQCIQGIEADMGVKLFSRGKSNLTLTRAGRIYYQWAKVTLDSVKRLENDIAAVKADTNRQLDIGSSWQRSAFLLPESINNFYQCVPSCNVKIYEDYGFRLLEKLASNELDLVISPSNQDPIHYHSVPIIYERFLVAAGKAFQLEHTEGDPFPYVDKNVFFGKPIILLQERQYLGQSFRKLLLDINYSPVKLTECTNLETAHKLVKNNVGLTLLPEISVVSIRYPDVHYYALEGEFSGRTISAVYRKGHPMEKEIRILIDCVKEFIKTFNHPFIIG